MIVFSTPSSLLARIPSLTFTPPSFHTSLLPQETDERYERYDERYDDRQDDDGYESSDDGSGGDASGGDGSGRESASRESGRESSSGMGMSQELAEDLMGDFHGSPGAASSPPAFSTDAVLQALSIAGAGQGSSERGEEENEGQPPRGPPVYPGGEEDVDDDEAAAEAADLQAALQLSISPRGSMSGS